MIFNRYIFYYNIFFFNLISKLRIIIYFIYSRSAIMFKSFILIRDSISIKLFHMRKYYKRF